MFVNSVVKNSVSLTIHSIHTSIKQFAISIYFFHFSSFENRENGKSFKMESVKGSKFYSNKSACKCTIDCTKVKWTFNLDQFRRSPLTSVLIVFIAMFLDGALLTTVVPIIPEKIKDIKITNWVRNLHQASVRKYR